MILEEADAIAKKRLQAAETYLEKISEPAKNVKASKVHCMKKVGQTESIKDINSFLACGDFCHLLITFANSLPPDQDQQHVSRHPDPNSLTL